MGATWPLGWARKLGGRELARELTLGGEEGAAMPGMG